MKRQFDKEIETLALKEAGEYFKTLLTGETTILPDELGMEIADQVPKSKRMRLSVVTDYMMMRIVECGFVVVKNEVEMVHGPIDVKINAHAETFRPYAFYPDKEFNEAINAEEEEEEEEEKPKEQPEEGEMWMVEDVVKYESCDTLGPFKTREDAELVAKVMIHKRDSREKDWKQEGPFVWKRDDRTISVFSKTPNEDLKNYKEMAKNFGIE